MQEFQILALNILPNDRSKIWERAQAEAESMDFFQAVAHTFSGVLRIENGTSYLEFPVRRIVANVVAILSNTFEMNFGSYYQERASSFNLLQSKGSDQNMGNPVNFEHKIVDGNINLKIEFTPHGIFESNIINLTNGKFTFIIPLVQFNRAVGKVYDQVLDFVENILGDIDGFDERFWTIPFRMELPDY